MATVGELTYPPILRPLQVQAPTWNPQQHKPTRLPWRQRILRISSNAIRDHGLSYGPDARMHYAGVAGGRIDIYA